LFLKAMLPSKRIKLDGEESDEDDICLQDVIKEAEMLEETANAVLGGSKIDKCSYPDGFVKRQAVFSCADCCDLENNPAGFCLACSINCHDGHDIYELYTKRNFRCDCGNEKFSNTCQLYEDKKESNIENKYNHNFQGLYCSCNKPYPSDDTDDEDDEEDMVQCIICEDWFHLNHLGKVPSSNDYAEMICMDCTKKCTFLGRYKPLSLDLESSNCHSSSISTYQEQKTFHCGVYNQQIKNEEKDKNISIKHPESKSEDIEEKIIPLENKKEDPKFTGASFWPFKWRQCLCNCKPCLDLYTNLGVGFIVDESDTLEYYENKDNHLDDQDSGNNQNNQQFGNFSRYQQGVYAAGIYDFITSISEFAKDCEEAGRTVTTEDVKKFADSLQKKREERFLRY